MKVKVKLAFCPTGPGGGTDNSCGKGGGSGKGEALTASKIASYQLDKEEAAKLVGAKLLFEHDYKDGETPTDFVAIRGNVGMVGDSEGTVTEHKFPSEKEAQDVMGKIVKGWGDDEQSDDWEDSMFEYFESRMES